MDTFVNAVMADFENNGITKDLDEMDLLIIECRRKKFLNLTASNCASLNRTLELVRSTLSNMRPLGKKKHCVFCKKNQERLEVYSTHLIRNPTGEVTCPILQKYVCPVCGATGKDAHTVKYCPLNGGFATTTDAVLKTPRNSIGRKRL